jgi:cysteine-S-conjugate beta-lyase
MTFDFDTPIDMRGIRASKWDYLPTVCNVDAPDAIAMWVADMDFAAPQVVRQAVADEAARGFLGYYGDTEGWREAQCGWLERRHGWRPDAAWLTPTPGILFVLALAMQEYSSPGDAVVLFSPVYHEFSRLILANDRQVHNQQMIEVQGRYTMDLEGLERDLPKNSRIVVLCSPHNPAGRVWTVDELNEVADFCIRHDLLLVSDEIHCDLVYSGYRHVPVAVAAPQVRDRLITMVGATKTFNIASAKVGTAIITNTEMKRDIDFGIRASGLGSPNRFGMVATIAAQSHGDAWLDALMVYLESNRDHFNSQMPRIVPGCRPMPMEATYLAWVDFAGTGLAPEEVLERIAKRARIGISPGPHFGPGGETRIRFNIATHRARLDEALDRLAAAFSDPR